jgi:hypothetical protein
MSQIWHIAFCVMYWFSRLKILRIWTNSAYCFVQCVVLSPFLNTRPLLFSQENWLEFFLLKWCSLMWRLHAAIVEIETPHATYLISLEHEKFLMCNLLVDFILLVNVKWDSILIYKNGGSAMFVWSMAPRRRARDHVPREAYWRKAARHMDALRLFMLYLSSVLPASPSEHRRWRNSKTSLLLRLQHYRIHQLQEFRPH